MTTVMKSIARGDRFMDGRIPEMRAAVNDRLTMVATLVGVAISLCARYNRY